MSGMNYDYFYGEQADSYAFYRIPKLLFTENEFSGLSIEAKTVYGILLDRMSMSAKNGWLDEAELELAKKEFVSTLTVLKVGEVSCAAYEIG